MRVKVRGSPWKLVLFFFDPMGLRGRTQAIKFSRSRHLLSHLPSSSFGFFLKMHKIATSGAGETGAQPVFCKGLAVKAVGV